MISDCDEISIDDLGIQPNMSMSLEESLDVLLNSPIRNKPDIATGIGLGMGTGISVVEFGRISPNSKPSAFNAVHMEVQENAKIPNTYHIPVRRNPAQPESRAKGTDPNGFMDEIMRLTEADLELTESFLGSDNRMGKAAAYSCSGALMSSIGTKVAEINNSFPVANIDDSNLKGSMENINLKASVNGAPGSAVLPPSTKIKSKTVQQPPSRWYGRPIPLPIPTRVVNSPSISHSSSHAMGNTLINQVNSPSHMKPTTTLKTVVKGKATIAPPANVVSSTPSSTINRNPATKYAASQPRVITGSIPNVTSSNQKIIPSNQHGPLFSRVLPSTLPPPPSLLEATKKRSQFGFGGNHKVPSIPQPPQPRPHQPQSSQQRPQQKRQQTQQKRKISQIRVNSPATNPNTKAAASAAAEHAKSKSPGTEGASYERKKQRAKDARVKLNESIERLSVAMSLAGTQSKERIKLHKGWVTGNSNSTANANTKNTVHIEELVSKAADDAKKWDRPSFVGSSASIVQHLNAECEALMREIGQLKKERLEWINSQSRLCLCGKVGEPKASNSVSDSGSFDDADNAGQEPDHVRKRRKIESIECVDMFSIFQHEKLSIIIGAFLDPLSIIRVTSVSRSWQYRLTCMRHEEIWSALCVKRYGCVQVMEWQDQLNSEDQISQWPHHDPSRMFAVNLYRRMNTANVKPKCYHEGSSHFGDGRIRNSVSAWVSLVERSNGETRRSVLTGSANDIKYASLPVVELRILIQNTGVPDSSISIPEQIISIDASTKRSRGAEMFEITSDDRFKKKLINLDGSERQSLSTNSGSGIATLTKLGLFESMILCTFIHATSCPTLKKFRAKAKYVKVLVNVRGITEPLVIPVIS